MATTEDAWISKKFGMIHRIAKVDTHKEPNETNYAEDNRSETLRRKLAGNEPSVSSNGGL